MGERTRRALVAGGSGGLGRAIAAALARDGCDVTITYRSNRAGADEAAAAVAAHGRVATVVPLDLTDADATGRTLDAAGAGGGLDVVAYAAGPYVPMRYVSALDPAAFQAQLVADAAAAGNLLLLALPHLRAARGCVVALTTTAVHRYAARDLLSTAPKAAVEQLVKAIAVEEGRHGVRANCVAPGIIDAGMLPELVARGDVPEAALDAARRSLPLRRLGSADDIAEAVAFLASPRAGWITGQTLAVDGGHAL